VVGQSRFADVAWCHEAVISGPSRRKIVFSIPYHERAQLAEQSVTVLDNSLTRDPGQSSWIFSTGSNHIGIPTQRDRSAAMT
jgi:hypothetical protein